MDIKNQLYQACLQNIERRISNAQESLDAAIAAGNEETKSSAGDKHETARTMMQIEQDKARAQLIKAMQLKNKLAQIKTNHKYDRATGGALAITGSGKFFISIGIGKINLGGETYYAVSPEAPIALAMMNKKEQEIVCFQNKEFVIQKIF
ncbi:MAG TPA: 3-oxoacyl-ACP synthase [Bacteroidetes bacterium]|nr:3-oxoacyl-ACP synthase [Bacteroidota bacterium]